MVNGPPSDSLHLAGKEAVFQSISFMFYYYLFLEKEMATHSSILAWRIPRTEEPDGLQSLESQRVSIVRLGVCPCGASLVAQMVKNLSATQETQVGKIPWRRKWQPTPVFLPEESHGPRSLAGYSPWGRKESDKTEWLTLSLTAIFLLLSTWQVLYVSSWWIKWDEDAYERIRGIRLPPTFTPSPCPLPT